MRVLFFRGLCDTGGVSSWMLSLERELRTRGVQCSYFFCEGSSRLADFERIAPTTVAPIEALIDRVATDAYDVLHIVSADPLAEILSLVPVGPKIVATNHGAPSDTWTSANALARTGVSLGISAIDQPSTDLEVETVYNGIDCTHFSSDPDSSKPRTPPPIVAWVGRTTSIEQKDFPRFLRVGRLLAERGVRLWVADAHGSDRSFFEQRGDPMPAIERWERVPFEEMPAFYREVAASGGALLMTSPMEAFGLAAAEAAACGLTTVGPDVLGLEEIIVPGVTGMRYSIEASDEEVARTVLDWLEKWNPQRARVASISACERFAATLMAERFLEIYSRTAPRLFAGLRSVEAHGLALRLPADVRTRMTGQRVYALTTSALRLSSIGRRKLALRVLAHALRVVPQAIRNSAPRKRILRALLNIANPFIRARADSR